jgi:alcohol dehydrogenase class IV
MFPIPHGTACARLLAPVVAINIHALRERAPSSPALARYDDVARILTGTPTARAEDAATWLAELVDALRIPSLGDYGITTSDVARVVEPARRASSMQGNPIVLPDDELAETLQRAI